MSDSHDFERRLGETLAMQTNESLDRRVLDGAQGPLRASRRRRRVRIAAVAAIAASVAVWTSNDDGEDSAARRSPAAGELDSLGYVGWPPAGPLATLERAQYIARVRLERTVSLDGGRVGYRGLLHGAVHGDLGEIGGPVLLVEPREGSPDPFTAEAPDFLGVERIHRMLADRAGEEPIEVLVALKSDDSEAYTAAFGTELRGTRISPAAPSPAGPPASTEGALARTIDLLVRSLLDSSADVRHDGMRALGSWNADGASASPLFRTDQRRVIALGLVDDDDVRVRAQLAWAIDASAGRGGIDALLALLFDASARVRGIAARKLGELGEGEVAAERADYVDLFLERDNALLGHEREVRLGLAADFVDELLGRSGRRITPPSPELYAFERANAAHVLGAMPPTPAIVDALLAGLRDEFPGPRRASALALARVGDSTVLDALRALVAGDEDARVVIAALYALSLLAEGVGIEGLVELLGHPDPLVAAQAAEALGLIGTKAALVALYRAIEQSPHPLVRAQALLAIVLGWPGDPEIADRAKKTLAHDPSPYVRAAVRALHRGHEPDRRK